MKQQIIARLRSLGNAEHAAHAQLYFKTGKGEYGEGDIFLGIRVPVVRKCVRDLRQASIDDAITVLQSKYHEARLLALLMLVDKYERSRAPAEQEIIYQAYLAHTDRINNWDLVDCSAHKIVGSHLLQRKRDLLYRLVQSNSLWERRISIISTFWFIRNGEFTDTLALAKQLLEDSEDLIHKATGWALREVGKQSYQIEDRFLQQHYHVMPRTMLRYAIEKFPEKQRQAYLYGKV